MKLCLISFVVVVAIIAIGTVEASPSPIRFVTPRPGIDYKIRTVTPNPRIRYLRSVQEDALVEDVAADDVSSISSEICARESEAAAVVASQTRFDFFEPVAIDHNLAKRSPERVVINYKPPPPNGPRHARSADAEEAQEFEGAEVVDG